MSTSAYRLAIMNYWRGKPLYLSNSDKIGCVLLKAMEVLIVLNDGNYEMLDYACKSLEMELNLNLEWDKTREVPLRDCIYGLCESLRFASVRFNKNLKDENENSINKNADRNEIDSEIKRIGQVREKAFNLSSIDKIGNMLTKALAVMGFLMESDADLEKLDLACKSLEMERRLAPTWDRNRYEPLRNCVYSMCEFLKITTDSYVAKNRKIRPTAAKVVSLQAEVADVEKAVITDDRGLPQLQTVKKEIISPRVIAVKDKRLISDIWDNHISNEFEATVSDHEESLIEGAHQSNEQRRRSNERISPNNFMHNIVEINKEPCNTTVTKSKRKSPEYLYRPLNSATTHDTNEVAIPPQAKKARYENEREIEDELICLSDSTSDDFSSTPSTNDDAFIHLDAKFSSFEEFRLSMEDWMNRNYQPFRIASSEKLNHCEPTEKAGGLIRTISPAGAEPQSGLNTTTRINVSRLLRSRSNIRTTDCRRSPSLNFRRSWGRSVVIIDNFPDTANAPRELS